VNWRRTVALAFVATQALGTACSWLWQHLDSSIGVPIWATALVLLMPGNVLGSWIAESVLWGSSFSLLAMGVFSTVLTLLINALVWLGAIRLMGWALSQRRKPAS
jgi:hypothetical protein